MLSARTLLPVVVAVGCAAGDGLELPPLEFETVHARIGVEQANSYPLCAKDLAELDRHIERVEGQLGIDREEPIVAYVLADAIPCGDDNLRACYFFEDDVIYGPWESLRHEVVHAVARDVPFPSLFWSEGTAEIVAGIRTYKDDSIVLDASSLEADALVNYVSASHFARFIIETRGWDGFNAAIRGDPLEDALGETAQELTAAYERDAPHSYPPFEPCPYPSLPEISNGVWSEQLDFSCASGEATQFEAEPDGWSSSPGAGISRTVELEEGTYALRLEGGEKILARRCQLTTESEPMADPFAFDIRSEGYGLPNEFEAGREHVVYIGAGTYWFGISSGSNDRVVAEITVTRID
jgi:hypothetical protein